MSLNNQMYKMYNEMVKGYKEDNDGLFEHGVRCWMDLNPENPFPSEDPAYEEFFLMQKGYTLWKMGSADRKINRRRMLEAAKRLCELNPKRPYRFDKKAEEEEKAAEAKKAEEERLAAEQAKEEPKKEMLLGVVPDESDVKANEEKAGFFGKLFKK